MGSDFDELKQVGILGPPCVGKSMLLNRAKIVDDADDPHDWDTRSHKPTVAVDFCFRTVSRTRFQIWDMAGVEQYSHAGTLYNTRTMHIQTYVCDASDLGSFDATKRLFDDGIHGSYPQAVVLVVNKMEAAVEGATEAAGELRAHMQLATDEFSASCGRPVSFGYSEVSLLDPPSLVVKKLGGGLGVLMYVPDRPGSVRIPAVGSAERVKKAMT